MTDAPQATVLLVDDDPELLTALRRALSSAPYRIIATTSPEKAVRFLRDDGIDIIVSDIEMPEMNGLELMEVARRVAPGAVRIILSGAGTVQSTTRAINDGEVHRFVHKPFEPAILRSILAEALERQRELERASEAALSVTRRKVLHEQLEREHRGITDIERDEDGAYLLDEVRAAAHADLLEEESPTS